jgi:hypothetical protein
MFVTGTRTMQNRILSCALSWEFLQILEHCQELQQNQATGRLRCYISMRSDWPNTSAGYDKAV